MSNYIFIETRDPFESRDVQFVEKTAAELRQRGHVVRVYLVQNGVLAARKEARDSYVARLTQAGVNVVADDFSLSERGIESNDLHGSIQLAGIESLVDALIQPNTKAIWH